MEKWVRITPKFYCQAKLQTEVIQSSIHEFPTVFLNNNS